MKKLLFICALGAVVNGVWAFLPPGLTPEFRDGMYELIVDFLKDGYSNGRVRPELADKLNKTYEKAMDLADWSEQDQRILSFIAQTSLLAIQDKEWNDELYQSIKNGLRQRSFPRYRDLP